MTDVEGRDPCGADVVTITSYNEWHEERRSGGFVSAPYSSYDGATA
jgi:hypothetical protein